MQMVRHCSKITRTNRQRNKELLEQPLAEETKTKHNHTSRHKTVPCWNTLYAKRRHSKLWLWRNFFRGVSEIAGNWLQLFVKKYFCNKQVSTSCRSSTTSLSILVWSFHNGKHEDQWWNGFLVQPLHGSRRVLATSFKLRAVIIWV